ncbi:hypothetical protein BJY01DRAFT_234163 [Aspergillus pseudoustus]|uniref:DUF1254 domain-containing protein n=1 Tax=Aspergillus pseudoustus TaxID=1810923 RepID=A0ABR4K8Y1_9EURO
MEASTPQDALAFAYLYGYPVYAYAQYVKTIPDAKPNVAYPFRNLATPDDRAVVRPNVDTLYTPLFYDISQADLEFVIPEIEDRYWLWPYYDLYGNNFANIGSLQGFRPGRYLLRHTDNNFGVQAQDVKDGYLAYVNSPTPYGMLLNRILVKYRTPEDLAKVHLIQDSMLFTPVSRPMGPHKDIPPLDLPAMLNTIDDSTPETLARSILILLATFHNNNPSIVPTDREAINQTLTLAGISMETNTFIQPPNTSLPHTISTANTLASTSRQPLGLSERMGNDWTQPASAISGNFTSFYAARMFSAQRGYLILTRDQAAYPAYTVPDAVSGSDRFSIAGDEAYVLTFTSGPPRVHDVNVNGNETQIGGFWSLTIYGVDQFLVPNGRHVWNLGDRSGLRDLEGQPLRNNKRQGEAQVFKILIQAADVRPPENWVGNWLPAPSGGGVFMISFRFYGACEEMFDGRWVYPVVEKVGAVKGK